MHRMTETSREKEWKVRAQRAVEDGESWERCKECLRYHPEGYDGPCDDDENRLPTTPAELVS